MDYQTKFIVLIHNLSNKIKFEKFQKWDIIIKQGYPNEKVYIMIDGLAEVINELKDYEYLDIDFISKKLKINILFRGVIQVCR